MSPNTIELEEILPESTLDRLHAEAERQHAPLADVVRAAIETYLDVDEYENTSDEKIEADLREAIHQMKSGERIPAREAIAALRKADAGGDNS